MAEARQNWTDGCGIQYLVLFGKHVQGQEDQAGAMARGEWALGLGFARPIWYSRSPAYMRWCSGDGMHDTAFTAVWLGH